jgi:hypothetical protein
MNTRFALLISLALICPFGLAAEDSPQQVFNRTTFEPQIQYPRIAHAARVQGDVIVAATLDEGWVKSVSVLSGHPMLRDAAARSLQNGWFPSAVSGTFTVTFHFVLIGRDKDEDWKKPEKTEWLLPDVTIVRRELPIEVMTTDTN